MKVKIKKESEESKDCSQCGGERILSRTPGWCPEGGRWVCLKCSNVEKVKSKQ